MGGSCRKQMILIHEIMLHSESPCYIFDTLRNQTGHRGTNDIFSGLIEHCTLAYVKLLKGTTSSPAE